MIRGVNKILLPTSQKFSADAFNDMENTSKKETSRYKLVEGGWTSPVIANYTCYTKTSKFLNFIRKCYQSFDFRHLVLILILINYFIGTNSIIWPLTGVGIFLITTICLLLVFMAGNKLQR